MKKYKLSVKRILAVILAVATMMTTASVDFASLADSYSSVGSIGDKTVASGGSIAEIFQAGSAYEKLTGGSFKLVLQAGQSVTYQVRAYQNLTDMTCPTSGAGGSDIIASGNVSNSTEDAKEETVNFTCNATKAPILNATESCAIVVTLTSDDATSITFCYGTTKSSGYTTDTGLATAKTSAYWTNTGNIIATQTTTVASPTDITSISADYSKVIMAVDESGNALDSDINLNAKVTPAYNRAVTYTVTGSSVTVDTTGLVHAASSGASTIDLTSANAASTYKNTINAYVLTIPTIADQVYTGSAIKPEPVIKLGGITLTKDTDYQLSYSDNTAVGKAKAIITGKGTYLGYSKEIEFNITKGEITQAMVNAADFTINTSDASITASTLSDGGRTLELGTDYTATAVLKSSDATTLTYTVSVKGKGAYNTTSGATLTRDYTVVASSDNKVDINDLVVAKFEGNKAKCSKEYTGLAIKPGVEFYSIVSGSKIESFADNVDIEYSNNVKVGSKTGKITITGKGNYEGTMNLYFSITERDINDSKVTFAFTSGSSVYTFTGSDMEPTFTLKYENPNGEVSNLVKGTDYKVTYYDNDGISDDAYLKITGKGNFAGTLKKQFKIKGDFKKHSVVYLDDDYACDYNGDFESDYEEDYTGSAFEPSVTIKINGVTLTKDTDYTYTYKDNVNAGKGKVVITGKGDYSGTITATFTINKKKLPGELQIDEGSLEKEYTGSAITLTAAEYAVKSGAKTLVEDQDYTIEYSNNTNVGTVTVTAKGAGNYFGTLTNSFTIKAKSLTDSEITVDSLQDETYTGSAIKPDVTVRYNGVALTSSDYSVEYDDNTAIGTATVTIKGKGNFKGTITRNFEIKAKTMESLTYMVEGQEVQLVNGKLVADYSVAYTGGEQKPNIVIKDGSKTLAGFTNYITRYDNNTNAGEAKITVTGAGAYAGSKVYIYFTIEKKDISDTNVKLSQYGNFTEGEKSLPNLTITDKGAVYGKQTLVKGTDYTITAGDDAKTSGEDKVATVTGTGNYTGTREYTYAIGNSLASNTTLKLINPVTNAECASGSKYACGYSLAYLGSELLPTVEVSYGGSPLGSTDYTVTRVSLTKSNTTDVYSANNAVKITVTGKGDYYGTKTLTYYVTPVDISSSNFTFADNTGNNFTYTYTGNKPTVNIKGSYKPGAKSYAMTSSDFTVDLEEVGPDAGSYAVVVSGEGNYCGEKTLTYTINKANLSDATRFAFSGIDAEYTYTGSPIVPKNWDLKDLTRNRTLYSDQDVDISITNNTAIGTATITASGRADSNYTGTKQLNFEIVAKKIENCTISNINDQLYDGTAKTPSFDLYDGDGRKMIKDTDYTVTYSSNTNPGKAKIEISPVLGGAYSGNKTFNFNIKGDLSDDSLFEIAGLPSNAVYNITSGDISVSGVYIKLKGTGESLTASDDYYKLVKENCSTPGKGRLLFVGQGYCYGSREAEVTVKGSLSDATIDMSDTFAYTGSQIKPSISVKYGSVVLTEGVDYIIEYGDNKDVGSGSVTVKPKDGSYYTGYKSSSFQIKYNLSTAEVSGYDASYSYTGVAIKPTVTLKCQNQDLVVGTDVSVDYGENTNAGIGTITITPKASTVMGQKVITFNINKVVINANQVKLDGVSVLAAKTYTGDAITPTVTVDNPVGAGTLTAGTDFAVTYADNVNAGTATVRVEGNGNYSGVAVKQFDINPKNISDSEVTVSIAPVCWAGGTGVTPNITITYNSRNLNAGKVDGDKKDYTFTLANNTDVSTDASKAHATIKGWGNFTGERTENFVVTTTDITNGSVKVNNASKTYDGKQTQLDIEVTCPTGDGGTYTLIRDTDYEVKYNGATVLNNASADIVNVGEYNIYIVAKRNFENTLAAVYKVTPKAIDSSDIEVTYTKKQDYTGSEVKPAITVTDKGRTNTVLTEGTDYVVEYSNNVASASANDPDAAPTITIKGLGNYDSQLKKTFSIGKSIVDDGADTTDVNFSLSKTSYDYYDGTEKKPSVTGKANGGATTLVPDRDYTVTYPSDMINAGTKDVVIKGTGQYYGTKTLTYTINKKPANLNKIKVELFYPDGTPYDEELDDDNSKWGYKTTYTGNKIQPKVKVYDLEISEDTPIASSNYEVIYEISVDNPANIVDVNTKANPAYVTVELKGNYQPVSNVKRTSLLVTKKSIEGDSFALTLDKSLYPYDDGNEIKPEITLTDLNEDNSTVTLVKGRDYEVEYENNKKAGKGTVTITGKGNYKGQLAKDFVIYADLATAEVTVEDQFLTGGTINPPVVVKCGGNTLEEGVDYLVSYNSDNNYTTSGNVYIDPAPGAPWYGGHATKTFSIAFDPSRLVVSNYANEYTYTGKEIKPDFTLKTPAGQDVTELIKSVTYSDDIINVGTVDVTIGIEANGVSDTLTTSFDIVPKAITTLKFRKLDEDTFTGKELRPPMYIYDGDYLLIQDKDYELTYTDNKNPGKAKVKVEGINNYGGESLVTFDIISPNIIGLKAETDSISRIKLTWVDSAKVTGYEIYNEAKTHRYGTTSSNSYTVTGLQQATTYGFYVRSYVTVDGEKTYGAFKYVSGETGIGAPDAKAYSASSGSATVAWSKNNSVTGYEIYRASSSEGNYVKIAVIPVKQNSFTDRGLNSGKVYYYKVRSYRKLADGEFVYGDYSPVKSVIVK